MIELQNAATHWGEILEFNESAPDSDWLCQRLDKRFARWAARQVMRFCTWRWFELEIRGHENLPPGGFILISNHCSHFDTMALVMALGKRGHELFIMGARDYFFNSRLRAWFFHGFLKVVPFDRHGDCANGLHTVASILKLGHSVLIYPEGTRSRTGELQAFKPGIGFLGAELGAPIVPCLIDGSFACLPRGARWPQRAKVRVTFAAPLHMAEYREQYAHLRRGEVYRKIATDLHTEVLNLSDNAILPT